MPDDLSRRVPEDPRTINTSQPHEMDYWSKTLGSTKAEITSAVRQVGNSVAAVRRKLGKG
jgi:hypothetical protein